MHANFSACRRPCDWTCRTLAPWIIPPALLLHQQGSWRRSSGFGARSATGAGRALNARSSMNTWCSPSGQSIMAARGTAPPTLMMRLGNARLRISSGRAPTGARGTCTRACAQLPADIWRCSSGRGTRGAARRCRREPPQVPTCSFSRPVPGWMLETDPVSRSKSIERVARSATRQSTPGPRPSRLPMQRRASEARHGRGRCELWCTD
mmetsp:Transcript_39044/g.90421  ORF Transcript_39044/g.90421 Transcript_39044/m.90421 type:complete len:208 (-) Transcript_39044:689-1312(-)